MMHRLPSATTCLSALVLVAGVSACGSASYVRKDAKSGELVLEGSYGFAMGDARRLVLAHCNGRHAQTERERTLRYECLDAEPLAHAHAVELDR